MEATHLPKCSWEARPEAIGMWHVASQPSDGAPLATFTPNSTFFNPLPSFLPSFLTFFLPFFRSSFLFWMSVDEVRNGNRNVIPSSPLTSRHFLNTFPVYSRLGSSSSFLTLIFLATFPRVTNTAFFSSSERGPERMDAGSGFDPAYLSSSPSPSPSLFSSSKGKDGKKGEGKEIPIDSFLSSSLISCLLTSALLWV
ncbi:hypothetical protein IE53DRAFT_158604 [Violaceomyces palustris]|uniref:Uncharacterized protein n=1 Tax=Violaceomyces palustris TaxID=1673888 RepID=A0ACD0P5W6_9BASI|nr:hypothetical protein IE53DRAFT_158604 [Violaceomyces palustris]